MSQELDSLISLAKALVAAAPKLAQMEGLDARILEQKKTIEALQASHQGLEDNIALKTREHERVMFKTKSDANSVIEQANDKANEIISTAQEQADAILRRAKDEAKNIEVGYVDKQAGLNKLIQDTKDAQDILDNIRALIKKAG